MEKYPTGTFCTGGSACTKTALVRKEAECQNGMRHREQRLAMFLAAVAEAADGKVFVNGKIVRHGWSCG